ncbi:MAG TPA: COX15/CtaA family protein [Bryobacteraceae bacterium]|nr:COX15/CtaA family protein [Bryobacteraceae bacterium]
MSRFAKFAWFVLLYNLFVILWGAYVRATGSGAGCGEHWPLCNGVAVPRSPQLATIIEFTHRLTSGLCLVLVLFLAAWAWRAFPNGSLIRRGAAWSVALTLTEALIGAGLVLLGHVAANQSVARGWSLSLHLVNTLLLISALTITAWLATRPEPSVPMGVSTQRLRWLFLAVAALVLIVGVSGAIAALGDTLFKTTSLSEGIQQDLDPAAHPFVRLRVLHPFLALTAAGCLIGLALYLVDPDRWGSVVSKLAYTLIGITILQTIWGALNIMLLAPVWLQLVHLLTADALWITFVLLGFEAVRHPHRLVVEPQKGEAKSWLRFVKQT